MNRHLWYTTPRFHRTASEAFRDYRYGACLEIPYPSVWRRMLDAIKEMVR
jgi:hypothetical protein